MSSPCLDSLLDFQLDSDLEVSLDSFRSTFIWSLHLLIGGFPSMVFEHLQDLFDFKYSTNGFPQLFHVVVGHIPRTIAQVLSFANFWL
jgi:hypothetical protein